MTWWVINDYQASTSQMRILFCTHTAYTTSTLRLEVWETHNSMKEPYSCDIHYWTSKTLIPLLCLPKLQISLVYESPIFSSIKTFTSTSATIRGTIPFEYRIRSNGLYRFPSCPLIHWNIFFAGLPELSHKIKLFRIYCQQDLSVSNILEEKA